MLTMFISVLVCSPLSFEWITLGFSETVRVGLGGRAFVPDRHRSVDLKHVCAGAAARARMRARFCALKTGVPGSLWPMRESV